MPTSRQRRQRRQRLRFEIKIRFLLRRHTKKNFIVNSCGELPIVEQPILDPAIYGKLSRGHF